MDRAILYRVRFLVRTQRNLYALGVIGKLKIAVGLYQVLCQVRKSPDQAVLRG